MSLESQQYRSRKKISGAQLASKLSSKFIERLCLKKQKRWKVIEEGFDFWSPQACAVENVHIPVNYTTYQTHINKNKKQTNKHNTKQRHTSLHSGATKVF